MSEVGIPSRLTITSPTCRPALNAGPAREILVTMTPSLTFSDSRLAMAAVTSSPFIPMSGRTTRPCSMRLSIIGIAVSELMANPIPWARLSTAVLMPMTCPSMSTSGPPLFSVVDGRVGLDHVIERLSLGPHRPAPSADNSKCDGRPALQGEGITHSHYPVADSYIV